MERKLWPQLNKNEKMSDDTDVVWICPVCNRGLHMCRRITSDNKHNCPDCKIPLSYPWEAD